MYFKSNEMEQCHTSFIVWVKRRNRPRYWTLLTEISNLRYAISYDEVKRLNRMDEDHKLDHLKNWFMQFVADNVEHNTDNVKVSSMRWALFLV